MEHGPFIVLKQRKECRCAYTEENDQFNCFKFSIELIILLYLYNYRLLYIISYILQTANLEKQTVLISKLQS